MKETNLPCNLPEVAQMEDRRVMTQENSWRALQAELKRMLPTCKVARGAHGGEKRKR